MTESQMAAAIFKRFNDAWFAAATAALGSVPVYSMENQPAPEVTPRAHVEILDGDSEQYTIGTRAKIRREGLVVVRLTTDPDIGRKQSDLMVQAVREVYERRRLYQPSPPPGEEGIVLRVGTATPVKNDRDRDQLRVVNVSIPFEWYEARTFVGG